jgi:hypothetical protein
MEGGCKGWEKARDGREGAGRGEGREEKARGSRDAVKVLEL